MKATRIVLICIIISALILWVRGGESVHIAKSLPFMGGEVGLHDWVKLAVMLATLWALGNLRRRRDHDDL